jgi:hypothetical protein
MTNWVDDFGFSAIDEDTYKKQVIAESQPQVLPADKDDLTLLELKIDKKLDDLRNMEKKIDKLLNLVYSQETVVEERKLYADALADKKVKALSEVILPLLDSLYRTQNQAYIHWPNRGPIIQKQKDKVQAILDGSYFKDGSPSS